MDLLRWAGLAQPSSWRLLLLLSVVLVSGVSVVRVTHEHRSLFNELQQLRGQANQLQVQWGQLLIEQSTFGLEGRIEQKATVELRMVLPALDSIVMVPNEP
ncbi:MAG: hypothetical protein RLZZ385_1785 [Pseudomonadota bacterium]